MPGARPAASNPSTQAPACLCPPRPPLTQLGLALELPGEAAG